MSSTLYFRETIAGQLIRQLGGKWLLPYPEDSPDFVVPFKYRMGDIVDDKEKDSGDTNATEEPPCDDTFSARRDTESGSVQQPGEPEQKVTTSEAQALKLLEKENYIIVDCEWYCFIVIKAKPHFPVLSQKVALPFFACCYRVLRK